MQVKVTVTFEWEDLGELVLSDTGRLVIPAVTESPGVYRFWMTSAANSDVYIGQASDLKRRMRNYSGTHSGATNSRIRTIMLTLLQNGGRIRYSIASKVQIVIDGTPIALDWNQFHVRLLVENAALAEARMDNLHAHNL